MKPNTPHAVFTVEHSIAVGGHFYSFANIQQTIFGLVHAFVMDTLVTNTEHPKTRVLLFRMLQYVYKFYVEGADPESERSITLYRGQLNSHFSLENVALHLPILDDEMVTFVDILTLCNYCILSNVLDPRTYNFPDIAYGQKANLTHLAQRERHDYNALSPDDRHYFSYVRGLAINLIRWLHCHFVFKREKNEYDVTMVARKYLHNQVRAILKYKMTAEKNRIGGVPNCTTAALRRQINLLFADGRLSELGGLSVDDLTDMDSLAWESHLKPERRKKAEYFCGRYRVLLTHLYY